MNTPTTDMLGTIHLLEEASIRSDNLPIQIEQIGYGLVSHAAVSTVLEAWTEQSASPGTCILIDLFLGQGDGLSAADLLRQQGVTWPIIFVGSVLTPKLFVKAMDRDAAAVLKRPIDSDLLSSSLSHAVSSPSDHVLPGQPEGRASPRNPAPGAITVDVGQGRDGRASTESSRDLIHANSRHHADPITASMVQAQPPASRPDILAQLTPTETKVLLHLREGAANKEVAYRMGVNDRTIETHRRNIRRKLGLRTAGELLAFAARLDM